ncbi:hypothetical protein TNCT_509951 [Trichonephila clavata]|uniref:Uncharacterized protein n=1 Tax=Trichonephila clavata TaxID=2740835 RepID=A0A8X6FFT0_TRICU|nr:hypothetical protein TNCT_509951 [Trichonephila clavata]
MVPFYDIRNNKLETPWHLAHDSVINKILDGIHDLFSSSRDGNEDAIVKLGRKGSDEIEAIKELLTRQHLIWWDMDVQTERLQLKRNFTKS